MQTQKRGSYRAELAGLIGVRGPDGRYTFGVDGEAEVVSARGRGSGGLGFIGGAGETEIHLQRRRISERRKILFAQIEEVRRTRALQRASRMRHGGSDGQGLATVAIVGLFATVDPRLRNVVLPLGRKVLVSDTIGFISDLPVQLVEAFHATLEEVVVADLLVHVLDSTAPNLEEHRLTVLSVLKQIGVSKEKLDNMIEVWNKIDARDECMDDDQCLDDGHGSFISEEDENDVDYENKIGSSRENEEDADDDIPNDNAHKVSSEDLKSIDKADQEDDHSYEWSESDDEHNHYSISVKSTANEPRRDWSKVLHHSQYQSSPDVKTSALKRIGLQELLEFIDQRLKHQDEKLKPKHVVQRNVFDRKWRSPREAEEETGVAI